MTRRVRAVQPGRATRLREIEVAVADQTSLSDVVRWVSSAGASRALCGVVTQDELTHDVVVRYAQASYLAYDVT